ncbi:hypothetical protein Pfo_021247 [Paulownia fortunei]|nr:hypothetical protein Pfo_021247 [Paulownia fortunei]
MGSCISKCRPKKKFKEDCSHVHDKLVISQDPISSVPPNMTTMPLEKPLSPAPSTSSTASFSSFSCSTNSKCTMASSISSSSSTSCSSSLLSTKDRSFSNEFLWSCVKDNPHIVGLNPMLKEKSLEKPVVSGNKIHPQNLDPPSLVASPIVVAKVKQSIQEKAMISVSTPRKRARASSPTLVRQKSFRKDQNSASSIPNRGLRSPSPSRRFNGENSRSVSTNGTNENSCRRPIVYKGNAANSATSGLKRESFRVPTASPNRELTISRNFSVRKKDSFSQQVSTKIDDHVAVGDIQSSQEMDAVMEDINNPLIALDCFIFL